MPFTASHPAILLPFLKINKRWVSSTALVAGSMAPDFEYFFRLRMYTSISHTVAGIFLFDLPVTLLLATLYQLFVRDLVVSNLPLRFQRRVPESRSGSWVAYLRRHWLVVIFSALAGICSHLLWDGFTHPRHFVTDVLPALRDQIFIFGSLLPVSFLLKLASSALGLVAIVCFAYLQPVVRPKLTREQPVGQWLLFWIKIFLFGCGFVLLNIFLRKDMGFGMEMLSRLIATSISGWLLGLFFFGWRYQMKTASNRVN